MRLASPPSMMPLNEGRGRSPGDTGWRCRGRSTPPTLNEGRGRSPGDTCACRRGTPPGPGTLNEGRGRSPGDTQVQGLAVQNIARSRSTKAGAAAPATQSGLVGSSEPLLNAQRRPGPQPRRHHGRSRTDAGCSRPLNEGRGRSPGDTRFILARTTGHVPSLNEGRGRSPGDTPRSSAARSRSSTPLNEGRGRSPGDTCRSGSCTRPPRPAQRRPGPQPRRHPPAPSRRRRESSSLNEGRGRSPGDTRRTAKG